MFDQNLQSEINKRQENDEPLAMAMVVRREAPTSSKQGDRALIAADGTVTGWIGGGCTKGIIIKEALEAMNQATPRLVRIEPNSNTISQKGVKNYTMTCMSGGTVEVYIEPIMQKTKLLIFGRSHIAKALCSLGTASGYSVKVISDLAEQEMFPKAEGVFGFDQFKEKVNSKDFIVVCTQGEDDEKSLKTAISFNTNYLGFVSSRRKATSIYNMLRQMGVDNDQLSKIKTPAGIDINAKTPEEVAISILAEIIQIKREGQQKESENKLKMPEPITQSVELQEDLYINPVCNIPVQKSTAKHVLEYNGDKVYFCCDGCKVSFEAEPEKYIVN